MTLSRTDVIERMAAQIEVLTAVNKKLQRNYGKALAANRHFGEGIAALRAEEARLLDVISQLVSETRHLKAQVDALRETKQGLESTETYDWLADQEEIAWLCNELDGQIQPYEMQDIRRAIYHSLAGSRSEHLQLVSRYRWRISRATNPSGRVTNNCPRDGAGGR